MPTPVVLWLLLTAGGLALCHVVLGVARRSFPVTAFVACGAVVSTASGLYAAHEALLDQARRSPGVGISWGLLLGLGFFAAGTVLAVAWAIVVRGGAFMLRRLFRRGH